MEGVGGGGVLFFSGPEAGFLHTMIGIACLEAVIKEPQRRGKIPSGKELCVGLEMDMCALTHEMLGLGSGAYIYRQTRRGGMGREG